MLVGLAALNEVSKQLLGCAFRATALFLCSIANRVLHIVLLIGWEDVGHLACVKDVVDILEEALLFDTVIGEDESRSFALSAHFAEQNLQVFAELDLRVNLLDLNLEDLHVGHLGSESGERLATRATDTDQESVTARLHQDSPDPQQVLNGEVEKHQVHDVVSHLVVTVKVLPCCLNLLLLVKDFLIRAFSNTERREDVSEHVSTELIKCLDLSVTGLVQMLEEKIEVCTERDFDSIRDSGQHPHAIFIADQTIAENASGFVSPKAHQLIGLLDLLLGCETQTIDDLGEVTQIESVVRLCGCGL